MTSESSETHRVTVEVDAPADEVSTHLSELMKDPEVRVVDIEPVDDGSDDGDVVYREDCVYGSVTAHDIYPRDEIKERIQQHARKEYDLLEWHGIDASELEVRWCTFEDGVILYKATHEDMPTITHEYLPQTGPETEEVVRDADVLPDGGTTKHNGTTRGEHDWSEHWPTDPQLTSGARDGFSLDVNETQLFFKCRRHFPMLVEIYVGEEEKPIGAFNSATEQTVALGGVDEMLADRLDEIRELPVEEIPGELDALAYRLNPAGREKP
jgi:hypothetical protein